MIVGYDGTGLSGYRINLSVIIKINAIQRMVGERDNLLDIACIPMIGKQVLYVVVNSGNPALVIVCSNDYVLCMLLNIGGGIRPSCCQGGVLAGIRDVFIEAIAITCISNIRVSACRWQWLEVWPVRTFNQVIDALCGAPDSERVLISGSIFQNQSLCI